MPRAKVTKKAGNGKPRKTTASARSGNGKKKTTRRTKKSASTRSKNDIVISDDERRAMIAEAAYLRAEARGFVGGDPTDDWLMAEHEIDERIAAH